MEDGRTGLLGAVPCAASDIETVAPVPENVAWRGLTPRGRLASALDGLSMQAIAFPPQAYRPLGSTACPVFGRAKRMQTAIFLFGDRSVGLMKSNHPSSPSFCFPEKWIVLVMVSDCAWRVAVASPTSSVIVRQPLKAMSAPCRSGVTVMATPVADGSNLRSVALGGVWSRRISTLPLSENRVVIEGAVRTSTPFSFASPAKSWGIFVNSDSTILVSIRISSAARSDAGSSIASARPMDGVVFMVGSMAKDDFFLQLSSTNSQRAPWFGKEFWIHLVPISSKMPHKLMKSSALQLL